MAMHGKYRGLRWAVCAGGAALRLVNDRTDKRFKRTLFIRTRQKPAHFRSNPVCQATKQQLNGQKDEELIRF